MIVVVNVSGGLVTGVVSDMRGIDVRIVDEDNDPVTVERWVTRADPEGVRDALSEALAAEEARRIEKLWRLGDDVPTGEHDGERVILSPWPDLEGGNLFDAYTPLVRVVWAWFDHKHPKGVGYLLYEME